MRKEVIEQNPKVEKLFAPISEKLDTATLQKLNAQVDVDGMLPEEVDERCLSENGCV